MTSPPRDEHQKISCKPLIITILCCMVSGMLYAACLPPFNFGLLVIFAFIPLFFAAEKYRWKARFLCGWLWGCAWSVFSYQFLREIHPVLPYLMMPVISLWPGVYTWALGYFLQNISRQDNLPEQLRGVLKLLTAAALFAVLEWTRCRLFVWNDLSITVWRMPLIMQIARITGRYGVTFLLVTAAWTVYGFFWKKITVSALITTVVLWGISLGYGTIQLNSQVHYNKPVTFKVALIQGNLPQMRRAGGREIKTAIDTYAGLTGRLLRQSSVDLVLWPECAVPIAYRGNSPAGSYYRNQVAQLAGTPLLIGTLDFTPDGSGMTNGALLIDSTGSITGKYDKFHRVPFGEYVPCREYLPQWMIRTFDMGRDLSAGVRLNPVNVLPGVRMGTVICYEGVFSYVTAGLAENGANVLAALSNDVWYPRSSEPEQHLANVVMRCVETALPMIRCSNNGGSGVVSPQGVFQQYIGTPAIRPELIREQAAGTVEVTIDKFPAKTFFVRFGNWLVYLAGCFLFLEGLMLIFQPRFRKNGSKY